MSTNVCCSAGYASMRVSGGSSAANSGKWPAISATERRAGVAQCYLSKLTGKLIEEEHQFSAAVMFGGNRYTATIDSGATASFVSEKLADNHTAE